MPSTSVAGSSFEDLAQLDRHGIDGRLSVAQQEDGAGQRVESVHHASRVVVDDRFALEHGGFDVSRRPVGGRTRRT